MRKFEPAPGREPGPRWITHARPGAAALDLGDAYLAELRSWWAAHGDGRALDQIMQVLPRHLRYITLTLVDQPAIQVPAGQLDQLRDALAARMARFEPTELTFGPAVPNTWRRARR
ncbi:MAG: hypothetical protein ACRDQ0_01790 [Pseudonocardia sp.]